MNVIKKTLLFCCNHGILNFLNDESYLKLKYWIKFDKKLNLKNPQTMSEKLQWLKLYDRKDLYTTMVDKVACKEYIASIIGSEYLIPTLGVWDNFDDINFDDLPDQFVIKCSHDSGGLIICKDKKELNVKAARKKINSSLKNNYYLHGREWPYKNVKPRIIAEKYMVDNTGGDLKDYKFFCFNGTVKALFIASERQNKDEETKFDFFDENFNHLNIKNGHPNASILPEKPINFELMKDLAKILSKNIPQLRVDFYEVNGKVFFGELTFFHWSGMVPFEPVEWDYIFGSWISLP